MKIQDTNIAVIGAGDWGKNIIKTLHGLRALGAVCDHHITAGHPLLAQYDVESATFEEILNNPEISGVMIATPTPTHFSLAEACLKASKHVFVEKPLATNEDEILTLQALAKKQDCTLMVGHLLLHHAAFQELLRQVSAGLIGAVRAVHTQRANFGKFRPEENVIWDLAPHDLSMILSVMQWAQPDHVKALPMIMQAGGPVEACNIHCQFGPVTSSTFLSRAFPHKQQMLMVVGEKGALIFDDTKPLDQKLQHFEGTFEYGPNGYTIQTQGARFLKVFDESPLTRECKAFIQANYGERVDDAPHALMITRLIGQIHDAFENA